MLTARYAAMPIKIYFLNSTEETYASVYQVGVLKELPTMPVTLQGTFNVEQKDFIKFDTLFNTINDLCKS